MSSATQQTHFSCDDMYMLERVLFRAGFGGSDSTVDKKIVDSAARFLMSRFRLGCSDEGALLAALRQHNAISSAAPAVRAALSGSRGVLDVAAASIAGLFQVAIKKPRYARASA